MSNIKKKSLASVLSLSVLFGNMSPFITNAEEIIKPSLVVTPNATENFIELDWNINDKSQPYQYQIHQVKEGATEPQSIQAKETAKVLNVYPTVSTMITYTTADGVTRTIPKSASAEMWMETPNADNAKGYGMGLIDVDPVSMADFNANPQSYLKNADGTWKYDVIYFGAWDTNSGQYPNDNALTYVEEFINYGGGVLAGHDTIGYNYGTKTGLGKLREYFNIKVGYWSNMSAGVDEGFNYFSGLKSTQLELSKNGLLSSYPWNLGDLGSTFNVPLTHSTSNLAFGDIWFTFYNETIWSSQVNLPTEYYKNSDFYLTTWNNTAMIQTGHSNGSATPDEQKILANTLFYLSQLTTDTSWTDRSGRDITAPKQPTIQGATYNKQTGNVQFSYQSVVDEGSNYTYFVEATGQNDKVKRVSEPVTATITSGLKGYSISVDTNPNTIPDTSIETTETNYSYLKTFSEDFYVHVGAVDNAGNMSVSHYKVDITAPEKPLLSSNPSIPTNGDVKVSASFPSSATYKKFTIGEAVIGNGAYNKPLLEGEQTLYVRGSGYNQRPLKEDHHLISLNGVNIIDPLTYPVDGYEQRGFQLIVLDKTTLEKKYEMNYDIHQQDARRNELADKLNSLGNDVIVILASQDSWQLNDNLKNALLRVGASSNIPSNQYRLPYVLIGVPGIGEGNGLEHFTSNEPDAPYAELGVKILDGMVHGLFYDYSAPIVVKNNDTKVSAKGIDSSGNHSAISSYTVNNIDRNAPAIQSVRQDVTTPTNQDVTLTATGGDGEFGVRKMYKPEPEVRGLLGTYYKNTIGASPALGTKVLERIDKNVDFSWGSGSPDPSLPVDGFGVVWTGLVYAPASGMYTFQTTNDDGSKLYINNQLIINKWVEQGNVTNNGTIQLEGGKWYPIQVEHYENGGGATSILRWKYGSMSAFEVIPTQQFTPLGDFSNGNSINKTVAVNGTHLFVAEDYAGNRTVTEATVSNIDKVAPNKPVISLNTTSQTNKDVTATVQYPDDSVKNLYSFVSDDGKMDTGTLPYTSPLLLDRNGKLTVSATDQAGNYSENQVVISNIDKVAPVAPTVQFSKTSITNEAITATATFSSDSVTRLYGFISDDGQIETIAKPYTSPIEIDRNGTFYLTAYDQAGNKIDVEFKVSNIDRIAPNNPTFTASKTALTNTDVAVTATFPTDAVIKQVRVNGASWISYTTSIIFSENGSIEGRSIDEAGNISIVTLYQVTNIDKDAPVTPLLTANKTNPTNTDVIVTASFPSDASTKEVRINGGSWTAYTSPITMIANGKVEVRAIDQAGNISNIAHYNVTNIDKVAPVKPIINPDQTSPTNGNVTVTATFASDVVMKEMNVNGEGWKLYEPTVFLSNGTIQVRGWDSAGNVSESSRYDVSNIDRVAPESPKYTVETNQNTFLLNPSEQAKLFYSVNDDKWIEYNSQVTFEDGSYEIAFKAVDLAGNESEIKILKEIMYRDALAVAVADVEKAETEKTQETVDGARTKVKLIPYNSTEYQPLMKRLDDLQALLDAKKAIEKAVETRSEVDVALAQEKIALLNNSNPVILDLMDEIETGYKEADILALVAKERYDILSTKYEMSKEGYTGLVNIYYAIKYPGDFMFKYAGEKVALVSTIDKHYTFVEEQYNKLKVVYGEFVDNRIQTDAEIKAENSVKTMETKYDPTMAVNTQNLINAVEDPTVRASLQQRLDSAKAKYEASLLAKVDQEAITSVETAERTMDSFYVSEAWKKVNALTNETLKGSLSERLKIVEEQMAFNKLIADAKRSVELAERYPSTTSYLTSAQTKVNALPECNEKADFQARIDKLKAGLDQIKVVKDANSAVSLAQSMKTQYYVDKARVAISLVTDETIRLDLTKKADAIVIK